MLLAAGLTGVFTTFLIEYFHKRARLQADAAIGVTFTWLFALGIIMISALAGRVDLDQDCVLYGEIAYVPIDLWITPGGLNMGPRPLWVLGTVLLLNLVFIFLGYKELKITTFDPAYATAIGLSTTLWHYLLMSMVSLTTVAAFESVGAILVIAFLIAPPAAAYLFTHRLIPMLLLTALLGVLVAAGGYVLAVLIDGSIAGAMATVAGVVFGLALLFSPTEGLLLRARRAGKASAG
jgi:manganese/zinc/iron transport system permease protein